PPAAPTPPPARRAPPRATPVALPAYRKSVRPRPERGGSLVTMTLVIIAPAVLASAILRPRSR
ncbi:MAG TPA: hypothetical protein VIU94_34440, partial [Streptomyces sp.]